MFILLLVFFINIFYENFIQNESHEEKLNENMYALVLNDSYLMLANYVLATAY